MIKFSRKAIEFLVIKMWSLAYCSCQFTEGIEGGIVLQIIQTYGLKILYQKAKTLQVDRIFWPDGSVVRIFQKAAMHAYKQSYLAQQQPRKSIQFNVCSSDLSHHALLPCLTASQASAHGLSPVTTSPQDNLIRPVSCYAIFKGRLLLSQPPDSIGRPTCIPTQP
eukprot:TRINITY_DN6351_c0_g1_i3.p2 TRINITY_DN6351_c0_g1~~TRINITY_DN6351_c0_g1_i3.p2  ORF type:complete len:165 (+),score=3.86 TRINITY_DN6351_c0_g1_i3:217-711(+)